MKKIMLFAILIVMCSVTACTGTELNNTTTVSTSSAKTEIPAETPKPSVVPSPSVQESIEPSAVATTAEAPPDNIPHKVEDFYGRWKIVDFDWSGPHKDIEDPNKLIGKYIYLYEDIWKTYTTERFEFQECTINNPGEIEIVNRKYHGIEAVQIWNLLEEDEEMPIYNLGRDGQAFGMAIVDEDTLILHAGVWFRLEKDINYIRDDL